MTTAFTTMRTIRDGLRSRAGLDGVRVESHTIARATADDQLILATFEGEEGFGELGRNREERYRIKGYALVRRPGAGEDDAIAIQDSVLDIYSELTTYLDENPTLGDTVTDLRMAKYTGEQGAEDSARWAGVAFEVAVWVG